MKQCHFCVNSQRLIDHKDVEVLKQFIDTISRMVSRKKTGLCAKHQRKLATSIKRARFLGLLSYTDK